MLELGVREMFHVLSFRLQILASALRLDNSHTSAFRWAKRTKGSSMGRQTVI